MAGTRCCDYPEGWIGSSAGPTIPGSESWEHNLVKLRSRGNDDKGYDSVNYDSETAEVSE